MRIFALIPAAGRSRRMRTHKLLLPVGHRRVIDHLVTALAHATDEVFVLRRSDDVDLREALACHPGVHVVEAGSDPDEMRDSVQLLLDHISRTCRPADDDGWLLSPADHPVIERTVLELLIDAFRERSTAMHLPTYHERNGHPLLAPWALARRVRELPPTEGVNALKRLPDVEVVRHPVENPSILWDLDTPEDYERLLTTLETGDE
ncbi:2-C-methyl-D-erythritol 4-phosphate cytidylyltransferase [Caulifigura coniformis]|uniref:2-C-methyl-D-erythritol 4-phosphate cytidylyltransferase n=1 Tax=Caulifigura coniformis TaxID=2527983 RepID=A0A517SH02_9PLAN|nr:NTP transferase domain-containing protein [Caulifigura coniformis]QDT55408.1 2-C-methyl-D-erythritol 4-phosphate cytidylyltransferase [Caulifigura coniformis]